MRKTILTLGLLSLSLPALHATGLFILEGSDAQTLHMLDPYSTDFLTGFRSFSSAPLLPVLAVGSDPVGDPNGNPANIVYTAGTIPSLATLLANYSAIYIGSPYGCCSQNDAIIAGHESDLAAFLGAGRGITVENYQGGSAFDSILGFTVDPTQVFGYGGAGGGSGCFDGNSWTTAGQAFGLGPDGGAVPNIGCFGHQAYDGAYWAANGFATELVKANPAAVGNSNAYIVITNGGGGLLEASSAPEPASALLLGGALLGLLGYRKRTRRTRFTNDIDTV